jgi:formylglycine-generating enzyme required for sulfatase activity
VGSFPPNGYGLLDMAGNVWEWTSDYFTPPPPRRGSQAVLCAPQPQVTAAVLDEAIPRRVIKGGSHLCAPSYCLRYRPAARQGEAVDTSTGHIGFRCIIRAATDATGSETP